MGRASASVGVSKVTTPESMTLPWTASAVSYSTLFMPLVAVPFAALLAGETITFLLVLGGAIILVGVCLGAFMRRPRRWSASRAPECLSVDGCPEVTPPRVPATRT